MDMYICNGVYHTFVALMLRMLDNHSEAAAFIITNSWDGAQGVAQRVPRVLANTEAYYVDEEQMERLMPPIKQKNNKKILSVFNLALRKFDYEKYEDSYRKTKYNRIYIAGFVPQFVDFVLHQHEYYSADIVLIDDGLGSRQRVDNPSLIAELLDYTGRMRLFRVVREQLFFSPELAWSRFSFIPSKGQIKPIKQEVERVGLDYEFFCEQLKKIYCYKESTYQFPRSLFISSGFDQYAQFESYYREEQAIAIICNEVIPDLCIKRHPGSRSRSKLTEYHSKICMEIPFLLEELEDKLLISSISAAVFNPKFIYDKEPYVILIYKLLGKGFARDVTKCTEDELDKWVDRWLIKAYRCKERIIIPNTIDELENALISFKNSISRKEGLEKFYANDQVSDGDVK